MVDLYTSFPFAVTISFEPRMLSSPALVTLTSRLIGCPFLTLSTAVIVMAASFCNGSITLMLSTYIGVFSSEAVAAPRILIRK